MRRVVWWVRRDLRLSDNLTLQQAQRDAESVVPVFILDPGLLESPNLAPARRQFLFDSLCDLDAALRGRGGRLILRAGNPERELVRVAREVRAEAVYHHLDITPYARRRDVRAERALAAAGVRVELFHDAYLAAPDQVRKADGGPYIVYTPYRRSFEKLVAVPPTRRTLGIAHIPPALRSLDLSKFMTVRNERFARGGEREAGRLLRSFLRRREGLPRYARNRNDMALDSTSHLSPHLHFGTISVRELMRTARSARNPSNAEHVDAWIGELIWREFYAQVLWHHPHAASTSFRAAYADLEWENDDAKFVAWCRGLTGYPVVDAAMRQLNATGWMQNRARMIVASFLTKDLLIDWRWGARHFMRHLVDGDLASNNGGWQWAAGTGTDAQPYFRIFNPVEQGKRYDPAGEYVKRWVPEIAQVPVRHIHAPWTFPGRSDAALDYPPPIVDHAAQRTRALALYRR